MNNTSSKISALIALTSREKEEFFPGPLEEEMKSLLPGAVWHDLPLDNGSHWLDLLKSTRPDVLVGAWETPSLPMALLNGAGPMPEYFCFLCGSVRKYVPREMIEKGLKVTNWGSVISDTVAECALLLILSCLRRSTYWNLAMHADGAWKEGRHPDTQSLFGRRVGLHGLGAIGRDLVELLRPFKVPVMAYSPSVPDEMFADLGVTRATTLEQLFEESDVLVELAPAKPENRHLVTEQVLRRLPEGATFVNVGRGMVVDEEALAKLALEGRLHLGLDVFEKEPLPKDSPLRGLPNVTLLPHLGGPTRDRRRECGRLALRNLRRFLDGGSLENLITTDVYDRAT